MAKQISEILSPVYNRRRFLQGLLSTSALLLAGCGGGGGGTQSGGTTNPPSGTVIDQPNWRSVKTTAVQAQRKWTVLVYMNGANDLESYGSLNMNQMETVGTNNDLNMVVQFKRIANRYDNSNGDWNDTRRYRITQDSNSSQINSELISQRDSVDMGKPETLQEFVRWGVATFPADRYCLVLWNHGAGWRSVESPGKRRGFSYDDVTGSHIDTVQIPAAINIDRKWDLIAFDSSLMQMAEVSYEIRDYARYIVGSEESPPGEGYPYDRIMRHLADNSNMGPDQLGRYFCDDTLAAFGASSDSTQSVLDTSKIADIVPAINSLGDALLAVKGTYGDQIITARTSAERYAYDDYRDILDFCRLLSEPSTGGQPLVPDGNVQNAVQNVRNAVSSAILYNVRGSQHSRSNGLSIFLPSPTSYRTIDVDQANGFGQRYGELSFTKAAPRWQEFLINGPR